MKTTNHNIKLKWPAGFVAVLLLLFLLPARLEARVVSGEVTDSVTGDPLAFVNLYFINSRGGVLTDDNGCFSFDAPSATGGVRVSSLGYAEKTVPVAQGYMHIRLSPNTTQLSEVVVRPKKQKYSKKNNPAVELMERVRRGIETRDPRRGKDYSYAKYERMALGLNNYHFEQEGRGAQKRFRFLKEYVDTSAVTGLPYLNLSVKEKAGMDVYADGRHREIVEGYLSRGVDEALDTENSMKMLTDVFREVDIFSNDITLMQNRFVSPLSSIGANYYKYFITDTVTIDNQRFVELMFAPHNPESFGFNGRMYVSATDSLPWVRKLVMQVPHATNLNYVNNLYVLQDYCADTAGYFHKINDCMVAELQLIPGTPVMYAERSTNYSNHSTEHRPSLAAYFDIPGETIELPDVFDRDEGFWLIARNARGSSTDAGVANLLSRLRDDKLFYWGEKILTILVKGYIKTGTKSKFDFGPVNTLVSANTVEGARFRIGGMTTANLSKRWFARGYVAYGTKDGRFKYRAETEYMLADKKYHSREFPVNGFRLEHEYDYDLIGQHYLFTNSDNMFLSWKRMPSNKVTLRRLSQLSYLYENASGLSLQASLRHVRQCPTRWLQFATAGSPADAPRFLGHYDIASLFFKIRFAPGEKFYQSKSERLPINMDAPVIQLTQEYGPKGFLGSDFSICRTELSLMKRFWLSAFGYTDILLKGGMLWTGVYYPALMWSNANLSYTIQPESFSLMSPMEFANDHYFSWDVTYWGNGILFNRIPLVRKAKLREVITCKGLMGGLNKRNNPQYNSTLLRFPDGAGISRMTATPYLELSAGIDNILTILRVDYVWRLTYRNTPGVDHSGVRVSLHFSF